MQLCQIIFNGPLLGEVVWPSTPTSSLRISYGISVLIVYAQYCDQMWTLLTNEILTKGGPASSESEEQAG